MSTNWRIAGSPRKAHAKGGREGGQGQPDRFGRAMAELAIGMIPGYSPQARGRSEGLL